jgi:hypothetical protein
MRHQGTLRGGSVFHTIVVGSKTIDYCPYVDHGNDTYTVFCPLYEQCIEVISHLQYFNYFPFWPKRGYDRRSANLVVFKQKLCRPNLNGEFFPHLKQPYWIRNNVSKDISYDIEWSPSFDWHLQINETTSLPLMTNVTYKQCKSKISSLDFVGDSHMDITSVYAMTLENQVPDLYGQVGIIAGKNGRHFDSQFLPAFTTVIKSRQRTATAHKPAVIIADVGLHDLQFAGVPHFYQYVLPFLVGNLSQMQREGMFRHVKLFLVGMTPKPPASHNYHRTASPAVITAMNRLMADKLAEARINFTFVEYFETARTFINKTSFATDHHYINFNRTLLLVNKTFIYYGKVGIALANYIINLACS